METCDDVVIALGYPRYRWQTVQGSSIDELHPGAVTSLGVRADLPPRLWLLFSTHIEEAASALRQLSRDYDAQPSNNQSKRRKRRRKEKPWLQLNAANPSLREWVSRLESASAGTTPLPDGASWFQCWGRLALTIVPHLRAQQALSSQQRARVKEKWFYVAPNPQFDMASVLKCYRNEFGMEPWEDESSVDLAQNLANLFLIEEMKSHTLRTFEISDASFILLPVDTLVSSRLKLPCQGTTHADRFAAILNASWQYLEDDSGSTGGQSLLTSLPLLIPATYWATRRDWSQQPRGHLFWEKLVARRGAIISTIDEYFGFDLPSALVVPYPSHFETRDFSLNRLADDSPHLLHKWPRQIGGRDIFFRGKISSGFMCMHPNLKILPLVQFESNIPAYTWVREVTFFLKNCQRDVPIRIFPFPFVRFCRQLTRYSEDCLDPEKLMLIFKTKTSVKSTAVTPIQIECEHPRFALYCAATHQRAGVFSIQLKQAVFLLSSLTISIFLSHDKLTGHRFY
jgi:hypothetical protein